MEEHYMSIPVSEFEELHNKIKELETTLRRKCILDNYGITIENVKYDRWLSIISSDAELAKWYGEPLASYVLEELAALVPANEDDQ